MNTPSKRAANKRYRQKRRREGTMPDTRTADQLRPKVKRWQAAHLEQVKLVKRVSAAVARAVKKGLLVKPDKCEECHEVRKLQASHADYNKPLEVRWLCQPCHSKYDHGDPKAPGMFGR